MGQFIQRLKFVRFDDILAIFPMIASFFLSLFFRLLNREIWLVCEREKEARDNGYWFFKYLCEKHSEINAVYAIKKNSVDYLKVKKLGKVIEFGSFMHWLYYWCAKYNISSQKEGKPNAALCFVLEVYFGFRKNRIYLKHGIIKDAQRWIYNDISKLTMLCTAAKKEQIFIQENFGYEKSKVKLTGLCRFDNLLSPHVVKRQIVIMPTMREWLREISSETTKYEKSNLFTESEYYKVWMSLLHSELLHKILDEYDVNVLFYPHPAMQKYLSDFSSASNRIKIASSHFFDMQNLLMESSLLITDYSSIFFDFAYMNKPLIYYQFDYEKYREGQYQQGYFSYKEDGFGPICFSENELCEKVEEYVKNNFKNSILYENRSRDFYAYRDSNNCFRTFKAIQTL
ncbi:CDP-glycerol glycerophosphotransferase family protein [Fibrobacter sp. UWB10]|uniref:CDP-glycerol glycerophosphotransferase family protein n=1 Tax=Fibrobacter sp. UWB10 TaxID=1896201 RepID=UPI00240312B6|nr:CDP-glycerol glycerophosphotransferase family protein [Fibrobacter sp. UWB10]SMP47312.1 CDP-glycerol glycerophosphotransferase, TagB/SpsB family [Fibrobacter sp. UWB10]